MFVSVLTVPLWSVGGGVKVVPRLIASSSAALVDAGRTLDCTLEKVATICMRLSISGPGPREQDWARWEKDTPHTARSHAAAVPRPPPPYYYGGGFITCSFL